MEQFTNIHGLLLTLQYVTVGVLFLEILIVFSKWKNTIHSYLFLACVASFVSNLGYLFEMNAKTEDAYILALKLSYAGRVWIVLAFFLFAAKMCGIRIRKGILYALVAVHVGIYLAVTAVGKNTLYYTEYHFIPDAEFPKFYHENGTIHDLFMGLNAVLCLTAFCWIIREFRGAKTGKARQRIGMVIMAFGVQIFSFLLQALKLLSISDYYDLTMPGVFLGTVFMLIGILGFDLLGTREIAKDFAIDRISEGIIAVDNDGRIQYYNEPAAAIYPQFDSFYSAISRLKNRIAKGKDKGESASKNAEDQPMLTPYDIISKISEAAQKGENLTVEDRIYTPEENELMYKGESYGKLYALVDDTEHYQYMEELKKQKDIADSANEAKSLFLARMSHEIRTPINAVLGMDEMILREAGEKSIRGYAADIMTAGRTLLSLINDILDLSKVEAGKMEIIPVRYDLSTLLNDLVNMISQRAAKKGLTFQVNADAKIPHILIGDEIRIRQCAMNLLTNAVKYTEKGSLTLWVSYEKKDDTHILLTVTVTDTGIGMREEDMESLFSPYKRIEEKRNRTIEGTGLGMSITRQLLDLMGSSLTVHSEYGKGSEFSFTILQEVAKWEDLGAYTPGYDRMAADAYEYHELFRAPEARILVVDDTEMNLTVIQSLLKKTKIRIDTAMSGKEAVELAKKQYYDAIFIDHMMADMDGIETLKHIRELDTCKDIPTVALTANAVSGAREMYLEAGFTDYLSKPVDGGMLEKMLADLLPADKVLAVDELTAAEEKTANSEMELDLDLPEEIDGEAGLKNCGSAEGYRSVLSVFHQTAAAKAEEIEEHYREGRLDEYTIKVHALKSSARIIGAKELSELAAGLEAAGKSNDLEYIRGNTDTLLAMFRSLNEKLSVLDEKPESLPVISEDRMKEAYQTMIEIAGSMDYGLMEDLLKDLRKYGLSEKDEERIGRIGNMLTELDWDGIVQTAKEGLGS